MLAGATDRGVCLLEFTDRRMLETQLSRLRKWRNAEILPGGHPLFVTLNRQLKEYFEKKRSVFDLPLDLPGTDFQRSVWAALLAIPPGETRTYAEQALAIGNSPAVRAVAKANGDNRVSIIVPCHRVIGSDGQLTGYGGGLWRKEWLLAHERAMAGQTLVGRVDGSS
jgi:AraC family transcriptional regulator of adaptative response/methylated-DNA-[protein]-cysteine methyltransferase